MVNESSEIPSVVAFHLRGMDKGGTEFRLKDLEDVYFRKCNVEHPGKENELVYPCNENIPSVVCSKCDSPYEHLRTFETEYILRAPGNPTGYAIIFVLECKKCPPGKNNDNRATIAFDLKVESSDIEDYKKIHDGKPIPKYGVSPKNNGAHG